MSDDIFQGYKGKALELLKKYKVRVWGKCEVETTRGKFEGTVLPRAENDDDLHIVLKIITGYISASSGKAKVCGMPVTESSLDTRRKIGYLPENNPLYLDMYVKEYLTFVGNIYKVPNLKERVDEMIEKVGNINKIRVEKSKGLIAKGEEALERYEFDYLLLCNKICGKSHYNMQMKIIVETQEEYDAWMKEQKIFKNSLIN